MHVFQNVAGGNLALIPTAAVISMKGLMKKITLFNLILESLNLKGKTRGKPKEKIEFVPFYISNKAMTC